MKYFALFNEDGERTASYASDGMPYTEADIREQFPEAIEISKEDFALYVTGEYIRDMETEKPIKKPPHIPTTEEKIAMLDADYKPQLAILVEALGLANLDNDTTLITELQNEYYVLKAQYQQEREAILNE